MQVTVHKSTDGKFFESFEAYKAHEEALQINAKLAQAQGQMNFGAAVEATSAPEASLVIPVAKLPDFIAANADKLREVLNSSVVVKRGRGAGKDKKAAASTAEQAA